MVGLVDNGGDAEKAGGVNANLWVGICMIVFAAAFALWTRLRPIVVRAAGRSGRVQPSTVTGTRWTRLLAMPCRFHSASTGCCPPSSVARAQQLGARRVAASHAQGPRAPGERMPGSGGASAAAAQVARRRC